jgi:DNA-binding NarL/FixJ family response regulator
MTATILLAHPYPIFRLGLRVLIEREPGWAVIGETGDGKTAIEMAQQQETQLVIVDTALPPLDGIETARGIIQACPQVRVAVMSGNQDRGRVPDALSAGATGVLRRDCDGDELIRGLQVVLSGRVYLSPVIAGIVVSNYLRPSGRGLVMRLTGRQREVLQMVAQGMSSKDIGARLKISPKTVDTHRLDLMEKLKLHSVAELTKFALREGFVSLED